MNMRKDIKRGHRYDSVNRETVALKEADILTIATEVSNQYDKAFKDLVDR